MSKNEELRKIVLTEEDYTAILASLQGRPLCGDSLFLIQELSRADIVPEERVGGKVVTLYSRALVAEEPTGVETEVTLVPPEQAEFGPGFQSVVSPLGATVLGLEEGESLEWLNFSSGERRKFTVKKVLFQPEAENRICVAS